MKGGKKSSTKNVYDSQHSPADQGYDEDDGENDAFENRKGGGNIKKIGGMKMAAKQGLGSDYDERQMKIASSGRNAINTDKDLGSDNNDMASMDNKSFDPDHEPRKEGGLGMKHSPSLPEIPKNMEGLSEGPTTGAPGDRKNNRGGAQSRSPNQRINQQMNDADGDSNVNLRS